MKNRIKKLVFNYNDYNYDDINSVKNALKHFVIDVMEFLKTGIEEDKPLKLDEDLSENSLQLLKDVFNEFIIDTETYPYIYNVLSEIENEINKINDIEKFKQVGLFGNNLDLKLRVYSELRSWLEKNSEEKSLNDKKKDKYNKIIGLIKSLLKSLATLLPGVAVVLDKMLEFKVYNSTREILS